jgi:hypothetical protein
MSRPGTVRLPQVPDSAREHAIMLFCQRILGLARDQEGTLVAATMMRPEFPVDLMYPSCGSVTFSNASPGTRVGSPRR